MRYAVYCLSGKENLLRFRLITLTGTTLTGILITYDCSAQIAIRRLTPMVASAVMPCVVESIPLSQKPKWDTTAIHETREGDLYELWAGNG